MSKPMKITVLGPIPKDTVTTYTGEQYQKYGCIIYTTAALSKLVGAQDRIVPVTHVRKVDAPKILDILSSLASVEVDHVDSFADSGDVVALRYLDQNMRIERQTGFMAPIVPGDVAGLLDSDAFVCLPISDYEVPYATLAYIRQHSAATVILDAHGPTMAVSRNGERTPKFWFERDLWLPYVDILQMNLREAGCSWFGAKYSLDSLQEAATIRLDELPHFASHCLDLGVKAVCVTLDQHGCVVYFRDSRGWTQEHFIKRVQAERVVDTTGCGDSFAAGLVFGYLKTGDYVTACQYGNAMGAQRCMGTALSIYKNLAGTERQIAETYGPSPSVGVGQTTCLPVFQDPQKPCATFDPVDSCTPQEPEHEWPR